MSITIMSAHGAVEERTYTRAQIKELVACYQSNGGNVAATLATALESELFANVKTGEDVMVWLWIVNDVRLVHEKLNHGKPTPLDLWIMEDLGITPAS